MNKDGVPGIIPKQNPRFQTIYNFFNNFIVHLHWKHFSTEGRTMNEGYRDGWGIKIGIKNNLQSSKIKTENFTISCALLWCLYTRSHPLRTTYFKKIIFSCTYQTILSNHHIVSNAVPPTMYMSLKYLMNWIPTRKYYAMRTHKWSTTKL